MSSVIICNGRSSSQRLTWRPITISWQCERQTFLSLHSGPEMDTRSSQSWHLGWLTHRRYSCSLWMESLGHICISLSWCLLLIYLFTWRWRRNTLGTWGWHCGHSGSTSYTLSSRSVIFGRRRCSSLVISFLPREVSREGGGNHQLGATEDSIGHSEFCGVGGLLSPIHLGFSKIAAPMAHLTRKEVPFV